MAEGILRALDPSLEVFSAGTQPAGGVHWAAVRAMAEIGIDISHAHPRHVGQFLGQAFDVVVTVCDHANEVCPVFTGHVGRRLHIGFEDPAAVTGTDQERLAAFRTVRDQIRAEFEKAFAPRVPPGTLRR